MQVLYHVPHASGDGSERSGTMLDMTDIVRKAQAIASGERPRPPVAELIGFDTVSFGGGEASIQLDVSQRHANPMGTLHGGILCDIADAAMGMAYASTLGPGETFTTLELK